jgi:FtsZ-binding cell division protein ZapB
MNSLEVLEKKISQLVSLVKNLQTENASLKKKLSSLEDDVLEGNESIDSLNSEKEKTKLFVSDLIKSIDALVESGSQS